jgi:hypothetical protein
MRVIRSRAAIFTVVTFASVLALSTLARADSRDSLFDQLRRIGIVLGIVTQTRDDVADVRARLDQVQIQLQAATHAIAGVAERLDGLPRTIAIRSRVLTREGQTTPFNLDGAAGLQPFDQIKRYIVTIDLRVLSRALIGTSRVSLFVGALDPDQPLIQTLTVLNVDAAFASSTPNSAMFTGPFVGTNAFFSIQRGADGLGDVELTINAAIEVLD